MRELKIYPVSLNISKIEEGLFLYVEGSYRNRDEAKQMSVTTAFYSNGFEDIYNVTKSALRDLQHNECMPIENLEFLDIEKENIIQRLVKKHNQNLKANLKSLFLKGLL